MNIRKAWGTNFAIDLGNDILIIAIIKITWTSFLSLETMQPQLRVIRSVFADICLTHINRASDAMDKDKNDETLSSYHDERAAQLRIVQHLSAACRAARSKELKNLPAAWILRQLNDVDAERCREGRTYYPGTLMYLLIAFPAMLFLVHESIGDAVIESVINSIASSVELLGAFLMSVSLLAIVLPVVLFVALVYFLNKGAISTPSPLIVYVPFYLILLVHHSPIYLSICPSPLNLLLSCHVTHPLVNCYRTRTIVLVLCATLVPPHLAHVIHRQCDDRWLPTANN